MTGRGLPERHPDWAARLAGLVAAAGTRPFRYGRWDCALFAAAAIEAQTGADIRPDWAYASRAGGLRRMRASGHADHLDFFRAHLPAVDPGRARPGDIAILPGAALGVVQGRFVYVVTRSGLGLSPRSAMLGALAV